MAKKTTKKAVVEQPQEEQTVLGAQPQETAQEEVDAKVTDEAKAIFKVY